MGGVIDSVADEVDRDKNDSVDGDEVDIETVVDDDVVEQTGNNNDNVEDAMSSLE